MRRRLGVAGGPVLALALAIGGCGGKSPTAPSPPASTALNGTWTGTISDSSAGQGRLELVLRETSLTASLTLLSGTWSVSFAAGSRNGSGVITGGATGPTVSLNLDQSFPPSCSPAVLPNAIHANGFVLNLTRASNRLTGQSTYYTCTDAFEGTVDLGR